ncbi:HyaD/HybD family hydrogenase maturation endopeptidase [Bacillaceae bacterium S4-13-56]
MNVLEKVKPITILGIGNTLYSDEGVGVHLLPLLEKELNSSERIHFVYGDTDSLRLLEDIESTDYLIILDAINGGKKPGTIYFMEGDEIPKYIGVKMSIHQIGFQEVLSVAKIRERLPQNMVMIGIQPASLELGVDVSDTIKKKMPQLVHVVSEQVEKWW